MKVGDQVIADGMTGVILCDFDNREFAEGYEGWDMPRLKCSAEGSLIPVL